MNLTIDNFEGPLDLLLHLVKTSKMDIYDIDVSIVIEKYLDFINGIDKFDLDTRSEYLVMAAELIHLKSKMLVNSDEEDSDDEYEFNTEDDLREKLIQYEEYKKISEVMIEYEDNRKDYLTKSPENLTMYQEKKELSNNMELTDLVDAFLELRKRIDYQKPINTKIAKKELNIEEKTSYIKTILKKNKKVSFFDLFIDNTKEELIVTFLAILNLGKESKIKLYQDKIFGNIFVERLT